MCTNTKHPPPLKGEKNNEKKILKNAYLAGIGNCIKELELAHKSSEKKNQQDGPMLPPSSLPDG